MLYNSFEYLMKFHIGTPPVEVLGVADTGSELTWIQCKPCEKCFEHIYPLFDLRASSTYKTLKCYSKQCKALIGHTGSCTRKHNKCQYSLRYMDGTVSNGHLATERLTFGKTSIEKGYFGNISSGIVGLGGGHLSMISQLDETIQGKFSYCFVPVFRNETSTIIFGEKARVPNSNKFSDTIVPSSRKSFQLFKTREGLYWKQIF
ncbi:aspartic proteinase CDR1-like [Apium graveolens]|uniref:aspartic proteinase CDR1-like n=1 Tax=Apium graveolens TaxID=4045 RepID=UPI003D7A4AB8